MRPAWLHFAARLLRHRWRDDAHHAIPNDLRMRLGARVAHGEQGHAAELRVCVESGLPTSYLWRGAAARDRAIALFGKLRVWDTELNNGVLLYVLLADQAIEIVADRGLVRRVPQADWDGIVARLREDLAEGRLEHGLIDAIDAISALLVRHFPLASGERSVNELPDLPDVR